MVVDVVVPKWLLDHEQIELVELAQMLDLIESIGGVGIATQSDVRPARANAFQNIEVPAGFHLHLNAAITGGKFALNLVQQLFDGILNADGNSARNLSQFATKQFPQRLLLLSGGNIPERVFDRSFGHAVTADSGHQVDAIGRMVDDLAENGRGKPVLDGEPSGIDPFGTVEGSAVGDTFGPTGDAVALSTDQQDTAIVDPAKAGLEEIDERHFDFTKS